MRSLIKKKFPITSAILFSSVLLLGACGNEDEVTQPATDETTDGGTETGTEGGNADGTAGGEAFGFVDFDLDVDYPDQDDALQVSYEEENDRIESEYENKLTNEDLEGDDAFNKIEPLLADLQLTSDMSEEEVINKVIEVFGIESNYESIEIEIEYPDGADLDYEARGN